MTTPSPRSPDSVRTARRLLATDAPPAGEDTPAAIAAALQQTCLRVCGNLRDSFGADGCNALFARALARAEAQHPTLRDLRRADHDTIHLEGVAGTAALHGIVPVSAAIEGLLAALIDILSRLIGEDMATQLIDHEAPRQKGDGAPRS
jgi:hypothetical protein